MVGMCGKLTRWVALGGLLTLALAPAGLAADGAEAEVDHVALAARLLADQHVDRAAQAIARVDPGQPGLDRRRFHTLQGLIRLKTKDFRGAIVALRTAIRSKPPVDPLEPAAAAARAERAEGPDPQLWLYLAQAHFGLEQFRQTLTALDKGGAALRGALSAHLMRAQSNWRLKRPEAALSALATGEKHLPGAAELMRMRVFYTVELGLFQEVMALGQAYLARAEAAPKDYVAVAEALRKGGEAEQAGWILEGARLRFPHDEEVVLALAHTYIDRERPLSAAIILEDAARTHARFTVEAAELYKQAGRYERALYLNARVHDQTAKFRQRLSLLLEMERYERVTAMAPTLERLGLLKEESVRYALAYGLYKTQDFAGAEHHLKRLSDPQLFESANQLRKAMAQCRERGWQCL